MCSIIMLVNLACGACEEDCARPRVDSPQGREKFDVRDASPIQIRNRIYYKTAIEL